MSRVRADLDSPWKDVIEHYFQDFMGFFFPAVQAQIDWQQPYKFLDKELQKILREAKVGRRYADKLVQVSLKSGGIVLLLIHVEVQAHREAGFAERMYRYNYRIRDRYNLPVSSFAILCDAHGNWRPQIYEQDLPGTRLSFQFSSVKLLDYATQWPALEAEANPFATVVMAHLKTQSTRRQPAERQTWKFYLARRLYERGYARKEVVNLLRFIDWVMILPKAMDALFWEEMQALEQEKQMPYLMGVERLSLAKGRKQGREEGSQQEALRMLTLLLQHRFQSVPEDLQARLSGLSVEQLESLAQALLTVDSLAAFERQLP